MVRARARGARQPLSCAHGHPSPELAQRLREVENRVPVLASQF